MWEGINWKDIFPIRDKTLSSEEASTGRERTFSTDIQMHNDSHTKVCKTYR